MWWEEKYQLGLIYRYTLTAKLVSIVWQTVKRAIIEILWVKGLMKIVKFVI